MSKVEEFMSLVDGVVDIPPEEAARIRKKYPVLTQRARAKKEKARRPAPSRRIKRP